MESTVKRLSARCDHLIRSDVGVILQTDTTSGIPIRPFTMLNTKGNPITVTIEDFYGSLAIGAIISIILFLLVLIYSHISKKLR